MKLDPPPGWLQWENKGWIHIHCALGSPGHQLIKNIYMAHSFVQSVLTAIQGEKQEKKNNP